MQGIVIASLDALIPLGIAVLLLAFPQWFTKRDLQAEENRQLAKRLQMVGWVLVAAGILILVANLGSTLSKR